MAVATVEQILDEITALPPQEQERLRALLNGQSPVNGQSPARKEPLGKFVEPIPAPNQQAAMQWLGAHGHEYEEQWVALDGDRLIAHDSDYWKVSEAAKASGVYLPLITFIEAIPERPFVRV